MMKKGSYLHLLAFAMATMLSVGFTSCGDDDDEGGASSYTTAEILDMISGTWEISGRYMMKYSLLESVIPDYYDEEDFYNQLNKDLEYTGTIEFTKDYKYRAKVYDEKGKSISDLGSINTYSTDKYYILKKQGKNYIVFGDNEEFLYEIVSVSKNNFKLLSKEDNYVIYDSFDHEEMGTVSWYISINSR